MSARFGLVGLDAFHYAHGVGKYLSNDPRVEFIGVADPEAGRREQYAAAFGAEATFDTLDELLAEGLDGIVVTNRTVDHAEAAIAALREGVHVACNKPLAATASEGEAMVAAAVESGRMLSVLYNYRYKPAYALTKRLLGDGVIGSVRFATMSTRAPVVEAGVFGEDPNWYWQRASAVGGGFLDHAVHSLDLLLHLTGRPVISSVFGYVTNLLHEDFDVDDYGVMTAVATDGTVFNLESTWTVSTQVGFQERLLVGGDAGELEATASSHPRVTVRPDRGLAHEISYDTDQEDWRPSIDATIADFVRAVVEGGDAPVPGTEALDVLRVVFDAYDSSKRGRRVGVV